MKRIISLGAFLSLLLVHCYHDRKNSQVVWDALQELQGMFEPQVEEPTTYQHGDLVEGKHWLDRPRPDRRMISSCNSTRLECGFNAARTAKSRIIDYAILGFAKCGSTTVGSALGKLGQAPRGDTCSSVVWSIHKSYHGWPSTYGKIPTRNNQNIMTGLKCPAGFEISSIIGSWSTYQPETLFIAGIRHPVLAFQSFFNMLVQNGWRVRDPYTLLSSCQNKGDCSARGCPKSNPMICADRVRYHVALAKLGKTPLGEKEMGLLPLNPAEIPLKTFSVPNRIFLYEVSQLTDTNQSRDDLFWSDLSSALELPFNISPDNVTIVKPGKKDLPPLQQKERNERKIDICHPENDRLREVLMNYAIQAADWICPYFLQDRTGVMVSDKEHFCGNVMESWRLDPCSKMSPIIREDNNLTSSVT